MRSARFVFIFGFFLCAIPICAQQVQIPSTKSAAAPSQRTASTVISPPAAQDSQAVTVLNQVLAAAGGAANIKAIADYRATGNVTYHWDQDAQGNVTVRGLGFSNVRIDANFAGAIYSRSIHDGQTSVRALDGSIRQYPPLGAVPSSDVYSYRPPMFPSSLVLPYAPLLAVLGNPRITISDKGLTQLDGHSVHDIQVQQVLRGRTDATAQYRTMDFYIDPNTFQVVMIQDMLPKNVVHQVRYANYTQTSSVQIPLSISETMGGQKTWEMELTGATFNSGLQDSDFALQ